MYRKYHILVSIIILQNYPHCGYTLVSPKHGEKVARFGNAKKYRVPWKPTI